MASCDGNIFDGVDVSHLSTPIKITKFMPVSRENEYSGSKETGGHGSTLSRSRDSVMKSNSKETHRFSPYKNLSKNHKPKRSFLSLMLISKEDNLLMKSLGVKVMYFRPWESATPVEPPVAPNTPHKSIRRCLFDSDASSSMISKESEDESISDDPYYARERPQSHMKMSPAVSKTNEPYLFGIGDSLTAIYYERKDKSTSDDSNACQEHQSPKEMSPDVSKPYRYLYGICKYSAKVPNSEDELTDDDSSYELTDDDSYYGWEEDQSSREMSPVISNLENEDKRFSPRVMKNNFETHSESPVPTEHSLNHISGLSENFAQALSLPTVQNRQHPDLISISTDTMASLLKGEFDSKISSFKIIDCRYSHEYEGGHIKTAINWYDLKMAQEYVAAQGNPPEILKEKSPRHIHIFHCEFSSERGPNTQRMLREIDRTVNVKYYPALYFPELYLLEGGYKAFYEAYPELCTPADVEMFDDRNAGDLKLYSNSKIYESQDELITDDSSSVCQEHQSRKEMSHVASKIDNKDQCFSPSVMKHNFETYLGSPVPTHSFTMSHDHISSGLTGDFAQALLLPTVQNNSHPDLKAISIDTMASLLRGEFDCKISSFKVLDCRYPYEYNGGHIKQAINWYNLNIIQEYVDARKKSPKILNEKSPRRIHIFHCEFSSERGPRAQRMLREIDRTVNKDRYPALHFPELYLLKGGYKAFYEAYPELCSPSGYVKMSDEKHKEDQTHHLLKSR